MKLLVYNLLFPFAFVLYLPVFVMKLIRRGGYARDFAERFGVYGRAKKAALRALDRPVWVHAVSVGEAVAALSFIRRWQERRPDLSFVLSTTTTTGHALAAKKLPEGVCLIYCPLDFYPSVARALRLVGPRMLVIFEVEFWPNLVSLSVRSGAPVVLANGRMSDRSAAGYAKHSWFFGDLFSRFSVFCMQSDEDANRVSRVVGDRVPVRACSTMKFDQIPDTSGADRAALFEHVFGADARLVWVAGSTHPGEEALVCEVFKALQADFPQLKLVLVPRHVERTAEVEKVLDAQGLTYRLLVASDAAPAGETGADVLLVNTTGELMAFYSIADVVFVGKSLAGNEGGHNIIEPAIFGKAIVHGSAMQNFRLVASMFRDREAAVEAATDDALAPALRGLLADPQARADLGQRARRLVDDSRGAINRTLDEFEALLPG